MFFCLFLQWQCLRPQLTVPTSITFPTRRRTWAAMLHGAPTPSAAWAAAAAVQSTRLRPSTSVRRPPLRNSSCLRHHNNSNRGKMLTAPARSSRLGRLSVRLNRFLSRFICFSDSSSSSGSSLTGVNALGSAESLLRSTPPSSAVLDTLTLPGKDKDGKDLPTPSSTPTTSRYVVDTFLIKVKIHVFHFSFFFFLRIL